MQRSVGRLFSWLYRLRGTADKRAAASHRIRKYFVRDRPPRRNDDGPFQDVGKLADIAGPVDGSELFNRFFGERFNDAVQRFAFFADDEVGEAPQITDPFLEGRQFQNEDGKPVIQVFTD